MPIDGRSSNPPPYIKSPPLSPRAGSPSSLVENNGEGNTEDPGKKPKRRFPKLKWLILGFLAVCIVLGVVVVLSIPDVSLYKTVNPAKTAFMRFRQQQRPKRKIPRLYWTKLSAISPSLIQAVLIAEDDKFFTHEGFDWESIRLAMESNIKKKRVFRGGSTITQQLAKNLYLSPSHSLLRKIREMAIAFALEKKLTKRRILELYLNVAEWGDGTFGVSAAAQRYFEIDPYLLSPSQSIRLASILPNPIRFQALRDDNRRMNRKRKLIALRMWQRHLLSDADYQQVLLELGLAEN